MNNQIQAAIKEVEKFNNSIKETLTAKGISNTGEAARSLFVEHGKDFVQSIGIFYIEFLDTGRGPGNPPPFKPILEWAMRKTGQNANDSWGLAVYVRDKIAKLGTEIFRNNNEGLQISKKIVTLRKELRGALLESTIVTVKQRLDRFKKQHIKNKYNI